MPGAVGDGVGDVTGQGRHHQGEADLGANLEQRPGQRALVRIVAGVDAAEGKCQSNQQAAGSDERQHERDAGHQVLVGAGAAGALVRGAAGSGAGGRSRAALHAGVGQRLVDQRRAIVDRRLGAALEHALAAEAGQVHFAVGGNDDDVCCADFFVGECVLRTHRALGFHPHLVAEFLGGLLQAFGGHEGVRDAGRAGGDGHDALVAASGATGIAGDGRVGVCGQLADRSGRVV